MLTVFARGPKTSPNRLSIQQSATRMMSSHIVCLAGDESGIGLWASHHGGNLLGHLVVRPGLTGQRSKSFPGRKNTTKTAEPFCPFCVHLASIFLRTKNVDANVRKLP